MDLTDSLKILGIGPEGAKARACASSPRNLANADSTFEERRRRSLSAQGS